MFNGFFLPSCIFFFSMLDKQLLMNKNKRKCYACSTKHQLFGYFHLPKPIHHQPTNEQKTQSLSNKPTHSGNVSQRGASNSNGWACKYVLRLINSTLPSLSLPHFSSPYIPSSLSKVITSCINRVSFIR